MKKRLSCLLLSVLMVVLCFAGCAEKTGEEVMIEIGEKASKDAVTLSMYLMSEEKVSEEQELAMEKAVNAITEKEFKIRLDLRYFTPDEYYTRLDADLAEMTEYYDGEGIGRKEETPVYIDENGLPVTFYPSIQDFEVDIFYFGGYDRYLKYKEAGYIRDISTEVNGVAKALKAVINTNLLEQVKVLNGRYDVIPVNRAIGEYTYMLLNKEVLRATQYSANEITSLVDENCQDLLKLTKEMLGDEYVPLKSFTGELDLIDVEFFGADENGFKTNSFSAVAGTYNSSWAYGAAGSFPQMTDIFNTANNGKLSVEEQIKVLKQYEFDGYYSDSDEKPFAVGYIKGGPEIVEEYSDDYEVVPVALPQLETEDIYEHLFAIAEDTNSVLKSSEILTYLNTNEEFRNLLLYGIEEENYVWVDAVDEDGNFIVDENGERYRVISMLDDKPELNYVMDPYKTGNVVIAYPAVGDNPETAELIREQNHNMKINYTFGLNFYNASFGDKTPLDLTALKKVTAESEKIYADIVAAQNADELTLAMEKLRALVDGDDVKAVLKTPEPVAEAPEGEEGGEATEPETPAKVYSVATYYDEWLIAKGLKVVAAE